MISAFLSESSLQDSDIKDFVSKKLDIINNVQICLAKNGDIILLPVDFPKSILSVLYALSLADYVLFEIGPEINSLTAELALCIENSGIQKGYSVLKDSSDLVSFDKFFSKYKVGVFNKIHNINEIEQKSEKRTSGFKYVSVDKHFIVKGIGSVIIGFIAGDSVSKGDRLYLLPSLKQCSIKSIQIMDIDSNSADTGAHVGLSLNNVSESDLSSNYAVSSLNQVYSELDVKVKVLDFYKENPFSKQLSFAFFGENLSLNLIKENDKVKARFNKAIPIVKGRYLLVDPSLSIGRNRIVGEFEIP